MIKRGFKGVWIPKDVWENRELSIMEKVFMVEIDSLDNTNGCIASNAHFAEFFQISKGRCTQIIKSLEAKKLVKIALTMKGKQIIKRQIRVVNKLTRGSEKTKSPYLENAQGSNTKDSNTSNKGFCPKSADMPGGLNATAWLEWCDYRSAKKKPVSQAAFNKQVKFLSGYSKTQQQQIIDKSISADYQGLFKPHETSNGTFGKPKNAAEAAEELRASIDADSYREANEPALVAIDRNVRP